MCIYLPIYVGLLGTKLAGESYSYVYYGPAGDM